LQTEILAYTGPPPLSPDPSKDGALSPGIWGQVTE